MMLQIRRLHARRSPPLGLAPTLKLFCHSFFSSLSGQSPVAAYATLHNAIARTTSAAAAVATVGKGGHLKNKMCSAASRHYRGLPLELGGHQQLFFDRQWNYESCLTFLVQSHKGKALCLSPGADL